MAKERSSNPFHQHHPEALASTLTVALELGDVAVEPGGTVRTTLDAIGAMSLLAQTSRLASGTGKTTALAMLVNRVDDPVDARITTDGLVGWVHHDDLEILVGGVLVDPV